MAGAKRIYLAAGKHYKEDYGVSLAAIRMTVMQSELASGAHVSGRKRRPLATDPP